jgi:hypothetical protein
LKCRTIIFAALFFGLSAVRSEAPNEDELIESATLQYIEFVYERLGPKLRATIPAKSRSEREIDTILAGVVKENAKCVVAAVRLQAHVQTIPLHEALPEIWCDCGPEDGVEFDRLAFRQARHACNSTMFRELKQ